MGTGRIWQSHWHQGMRRVLRDSPSPKSWAPYVQLGFSWFLGEYNKKAIFPLLPPHACERKQCMLHFGAGTAQVGRKLCAWLVSGPRVALGWAWQVWGMFGVSWSLRVTAASWKSCFHAESESPVLVGQHGSIQALQEVLGCSKNRCRCWVKKGMLSWSCCSWALWRLVAALAAGTMRCEVLRELRRVMAVKKRREPHHFGDV